MVKGNPGNFPMLRGEFPQGRGIGYVPFVKAIVAITDALAVIPRFPLSRENIYKKSTYNRKENRGEAVAFLGESHTGWNHLC